MKTNVYDVTAGFPAVARDHLREIANETGVDYLDYRSREESVVLPGGQTCETWYDEGSSSPFAWRAFVLGAGTASGLSREAAIQAITEKLSRP